MLTSDNKERFDLYIDAISDQLAGLLRCSPQEARRKVIPYEHALRMLGMYDSPRDMALVIKNFLDNGWSSEQWEQHILKLQKAKPYTSNIGPQDGMDIVLSSINVLNDKRPVKVSVRRGKQLARTPKKRTPRSDRWSLDINQIAGIGLSRDISTGTVLSKIGEASLQNSVVASLYRVGKEKVLVVKGSDKMQVQNVVVRHEQ